MSVPPEISRGIEDLLPPLLGTFERIEWVQRHLYPPRALQLAERLAPSTDAVAHPLQAMEALAWPEELHFIRDRLLDVGRQTLDLVAAFVEASAALDDPIALYRALRRFARIQEALYPL